MIARTNKNSLFTFGFILVFTLILSACNSYEPEPDSEFLKNHTVETQFTNQVGDIKVQLPKSYHTHPDKHYPVLYTTRGNRLDIRLTNTVLTELVDSGKIPEMIIVASNGYHRVSPLNPNVDNSGEGGAEEYIEYTEAELFPFIENHYRVTPFKLFSGHSDAAKLLTYALTEKPNLFDGYIIQGPNFQNKWFPYFRERMENLFSQNTELKSSFYLMIGENDIDRRLESFNQFVDFLKENAPDSFQWKATIQPGVDHNEVEAPGIHHGLLYSFSEER